MNNMPIFSAEPVPVAAPSEKHLTANRSFQGIPGIAVLPSGRLFAVCYTGGVTENRDNFVVVFVSDDRGEHWSDVVAVVDPPQPDVRAFDPTLWISPQEKLYLFWAQSFSDLLNIQTYDGVGGVWFAALENPEDSPEAFRWSPPRRAAHGIMMNKPTVLSDGTWVLPCSAWQNYATRPDGMEPFRGAGLWASKDNGNTFEFRGRARLQAGSVFDEHVFVEQKDGRLWNLMRTNYNVLGADGKMLFGVAESFSSNGGRTWTEPTTAGFCGPNSRFYVFRLSSGNLLLLNNRIGPREVESTWAPRRNLTAFLSEDDGKTWSASILLDEREGVSYPDAMQAKDGTIYVAYDFDRSRGEIFCARITEADVKAGRIVSPSSRLKIPVNSTKK